jgi:hypothetical protein
MRRSLVVSLVVVGLLAPASARAWNDFGHMEVAAVAFAKLAPKARARASALLRLNPRHAIWVAGAKKGDVDVVAFMRAATWADAIKTDPSYLDEARAPAAPLGYADRSKHNSWHYVDTPYSLDGTPTVPAPVPNAATEIPRLAAALGDPAASDDAKSYALTWLLHLVGDVHQPLHCAERYDAALPKGDRGGNRIKITGATQPVPCDDPRYCPYGPPENLHYFWDDLAGAGYAPAPVRAAAAKLPAADPKAAAAPPAVWFAEGFELARTVVYAAPIGAGEGPFAIDAKYQAAAEKVARARMALAGARLAKLIDDALGK